MKVIREADLPAEWKLAKISDVAEVNPRFDKSSVSDDLEVSFVPMPAVAAESGAIDVTETRPFATVKKGYTGFLEGDVLFAKITPCMENGKMAVVPELKNNVGFGSTEFHVLRPKPGILPEYLYYFVSAKPFRYEAEHNMSGAVGQKRVPAAYLSTRDIPVPPTDVQRRIVAKIEALFSELDKGVESLKTAREQLKIYRQAVLKHAFEGKLTARWREENADKLESPEQLLARIQQEREARYQQQLQEWKAVVKAWEKNEKEGKKPGKPKKYKAIKKDSINLGNLPSEWAATCVADLNSDVFDGPFGSNLKSSDYVEDGVRVIRLENIGYLKFIENKRSYITKEKYASLEKHTVHDGDIIFSSFVTEGIRIAVLPKSIDKAVNKADCFCVRLHGKSVRNDYLASYLSTRSAYKQIEAEIHGVGRPRINTSQLKGFSVPLCSREEQDEIMQQLKRSLSVTDQLEMTIVQELSRCETIRQSILKKGFSGQLIFKDFDDDPSSPLSAPTGRSEYAKVS